MDHILHETFPEGCFRKRILQLTMDGLHDFPRHTRHRHPLPLCLGNKAGNIKTDHMIPVQVRQIPLCPRNLPAIKKPMGITGTVIIRTQHLCRIGLSETPRPADAGQHLHCPYGFIDQCNHPRFIHIFRL